MVFRIALTDVQQQNAHFPLEAHALLSHGSDYIMLMMSHVVALYIIDLWIRFIEKLHGTAMVAVSLPG